VSAGARRRGLVFTFHEPHMNGEASNASELMRQSFLILDETKSSVIRCWGKEYRTMMIIMLAAAMTLAMLIATAFGLHQEAEKVRLDERNKSMNRYLPK
jgi:hypothetical protein